MRDDFDGISRPRPQVAIAVLVELVERSGMADVLPLDESYASVERLERYLRAVAEGAVSHGLAKEEFRWHAAAYLGQVCIRNLGGRWEIREGVPAITTIPGLPAGHAIFPTRSIVQYGRRPLPGSLREGLQVHDLSYMEARLERFQAELPAALGRFEERVGLHPGELRLSLPAVVHAEALLSDTIAARRPVSVGGSVDPVVEEVADLCARLVGEVVRVESGGRWAFTREPAALDFGYICVGHRRATPPDTYFNPYFAVGGFRGSREPGLLVQICENGARAGDAH
jgi:hypothetical protein